MKQPKYHVRKVADHIHIWRVEPLFKQRFSPLDLMLSRISEIHEPYWYNGDSEKPTCASVMAHASAIAASDLSYPILICEDHKIIAGMHRVMKAFGEGMQTIRAHQIDLPAPDFIDIDLDELDQT